MGYRILNNKKTTRGRKIKQIRFDDTVAFVLMPRFGTNTYDKMPDFRERVTVKEVSKKDLKHIVDTFTEKDTVRVRERMLRKARKEAWNKNVSEAEEQAEKIAKTFPEGDIIILRKTTNTALKIKEK
jgi:hypothetical protein